LRSPAITEEKEPRRPSPFWMIHYERSEEFRRHR
jgi:hypothetical protein